MTKPETANVWQNPNQWNPGKLRKNSISIYPIQERPRFLRFEMYLALKAYLNTGDKQKLADFSYWFKEWKKHFAYEYENSFDRDFGTLVYIEKMQSWLKKEPNNKSINFKNELLGSLLTDETEDELKEKFDLQFESDILGPLAEFVLTRYTQRTEWQLSVNKGDSPLKILANKVKAKKPKMSFGRKSEFLNLAVRKMYQIDIEGQLDRAVSGIVQSKVVKLVIPKSKLELPDRIAGRSFKSFFNYKNAKDVNLHLFRSEFRLQGKNNYHDFREGDVMVSAKQTPCGAEDSIILVYDKAPVKVEWPAEPSKRTNWLCAK